MIYCSNYKIGLEDIGINNEATNKALLTIMEDVAGLHSASVGYGVLEIETKKRVWMLLDWKVKVIKRPKYNDDIKAETWSRKVERLYAYRDFQLKDKEGNIIAIGTSRWIFVDTDRRRPVRLTADIADLYESETDKNVFPEKIEDIECEDYLFKKDYYIQRRDIDINEHMHNLSYLDMAYEILPEDIYKNKVFDNIRIVYKKEILYGEKIECYYEEQNNKHIITAKTEDKINAIIELS
ncbi:MULTISPECIES: acyl-[acyl-carrier-protein] thioesterase [Romboutsia]|uniref:acyl-[acyl-carrier-protein] thioesterase n=1 Tax=Romboutsia TaxID=1501226 RepID=UPI00189A7A11|nr:MULTISPECIES: acyl-ACP thioesterase domain-containing protein [Romboutsia]MCH1959796.1 thioesterase [Romboutsia hominis]MCH1969781.1 thioesterase [Romboutsia hominis]MDB8792547.1 thioesterase [Romboutsia sp. 1001216sp1]MDB8796285.1 thioesterase [Romboutsia sp. 1001216sp1]MDB8798279.1 thioesterase [Romboutsia sp. 1001216sp1]